jgi:UPF0755 protein
MIKKIFKVGCLIAALFIATSGALLFWLDRELSRVMTPPGPTLVEIPSGRSTRAILEQLEKSAVIKDARLARFFLTYRMPGATLKAGEYLFDRPARLADVLARLDRGDVLTHKITIIEGLTLEESAEVLARAGWGGLDDFLVAMRNPARIADLDPRAQELEGYLYPDTYAFARGTGPQEIVETMVRTFRKHYDRNISGLLGPSLPLDLRELVTLASIIEKETQAPEEAPLVASVYRNRLRIGMGLYADPTIIFALKKLGRWDGNLRKDDLKLESPFNTYRVPGLPPSPICSPGIQSLLAAAQPAATNYLYFVSKNDGTHVFAETLGEHNRNVEVWQRQYWRRKWAEERAKR